MPIPIIQFSPDSKLYAESFPAQFIHLALAKIDEIKQANPKKSKGTPEEEYARHLIEIQHDFLKTINDTLKHFDKQKIASLRHLFELDTKIKQLQKKAISPAKAIYDAMKKTLPALILSTKKEVKKNLTKTEHTKEDKEDLETKLHDQFQEQFKSILANKLQTNKDKFIKTALSLTPDAEQTFNEISKLVLDHQYNGTTERELKPAIKGLKKRIYEQFEKYDYTLSHQSTYDLFLFIAELLVQAPSQLKELIPFFNPEVVSGENANYHGFFTRHLLELFNLIPFKSTLDPEVPTDYKYQVSTYFEDTNPEIHLYSGADYYKESLIPALQELLTHLTQKSTLAFRKAFSPELTAAAGWIERYKKVTTIKYTIDIHLNINYLLTTNTFEKEKIDPHFDNCMNELTKLADEFAEAVEPKTHTVWQTSVEELLDQCQNNFEIQKQRWEKCQLRYPQMLKHSINGPGTATARQESTSLTDLKEPPEQALTPLPSTAEFEQKLRFFAQTAKEKDENSSNSKIITLKLLQEFKNCLSSINNFETFKDIFKVIFEQLEKQKKTTPVAHWSSLYELLGLNDKIKAWCGLHSSGLKTFVSFFPREPNKKEVAALIKQLFEKVETTIKDYEHSLAALQNTADSSSHTALNTLLTA